MTILIADFTTMEETVTTPKKKKAAEDVFEITNAEITAPKPPKEKKQPKKLKEDKEPESNWRNDGRLAKITGLLLTLFSFVLAVAFTSYLFTLSDDQSEIINGGLTSVTDNSVQVKNALGRLGAGLANLFINNLFGLSSYLFAVTSFAVGFNLLVQKIVFNVLKIAAYSFIGVIWFSSALAFANSLIQPNSILNWGGAFGNYLTGEAGYLTGLIKTTGVAALLFSTALVTAIVVYNINFSFILNAFNVFSKKEEEDTLLTSAAITTTSKTVPEFRDTSENIFGKDNLTDLANQVINAPLNLEVEQLEDDFKLIDSNTGKELKNSFDEGDLELEVAQPVEEVIAEKAHTGLHINYDPTLDLSNYKFPTLDLLEEHGSDKVKIDAEELERNKTQIISTLNNYQIEISKIKATIGPTVTLYEIVPAPGVRISKIKNLEDDIALSLAALGIRIIAPIPGKGTIGIEVPNAHKEVVSMRSLLSSDKFQNSTAELPICLGKSISNEIYVADLAKMPHLLMAGATGQ